MKSEAGCRVVYLNKGNVENVLISCVFLPRCRQCVRRSDFQGAYFYRAALKSLRGAATLHPDATEGRNRHVALGGKVERFRSEMRLGAQEAVGESVARQSNASPPGYEAGTPSAVQTTHIRDVSEHLTSDPWVGSGSPRGTVAAPVSLPTVA